jgi:hypothetical protein
LSILPNLNAEIFFELGLQAAREVLIRFIGNNGQEIHSFVVDALAGLINWQPQPPADLLPLLLDRLRLIQGAYLEHTGIVPAFAKGRMRKDKAQRHVGIEQPLLFTHNETVSVVIVGRVAARVLRVTLLVLRKIAVVNVGNVKRDETLINRLGGQLAICFLEPLADLSETRRTVIIIDAVIGDPVDKEQGEHLDALALEGALLLQMLFDCLIDLSLHDISAQATEFTSQYLSLSDGIEDPEMIVRIVYEAMEEARLEPARKWPRI